MEHLRAILSSGDLPGFQKHVHSVQTKANTLNDYIPQALQPMFMTDSNYELISWFLGSEYCVASEHYLDLAYRNYAYRVVNLLVEHARHTESFLKLLLKFGHLINFAVNAQHFHVIELLLKYQEPAVILDMIDFKLIIQLERGFNLLDQILENAQPALSELYRQKDPYRALQKSIVENVFELAAEKDILPYLAIIRKYLNRHVTWHMLDHNSVIIVKLKASYFDHLIALSFQIDAKVFMKTSLKPFTFAYLDTLLERRLISIPLVDYIFSLPVDGIIKYLKTTEVVILQKSVTIETGITELYIKCFGTSASLEYRRHLFTSLLENQFRPQMDRFVREIIKSPIAVDMREVLHQSPLRLNAASYLQNKDHEGYFDLRQQLINRNLDFMIELTPQCAQYLQNWESQLRLRFGSDDPTVITNLNEIYSGQYLRIRFLSRNIEIVWETCLQVKRIKTKEYHNPSRSERQSIFLHEGFIISRQQVPIAQWLHAYLPQQISYRCEFGKMHPKLRDKTEYVRLFKYFPTLLDLSILAVRKLSLGKNLRGIVPVELYDRLYHGW